MTHYRLTKLAEFNMRWPHGARPPISIKIENNKGGEGLPMPEMHYVESSAVEAIGYDPGRQELYVRFLESGENYVYYNVEEWVFKEMMQADSKGTYLNTSIKDRYKYSKL